MRKANVFARRMNKWELVSTNVKPHLEEMPFLQPMVSELDGLIEEGKALDTTQEQARQTLSDATHRRQDLERRGELLRNRINAHLKGRFGVSSDQLIQFGIAPRPKTLRRKPSSAKKNPPVNGQAV